MSEETELIKERLQVASVVGEYVQLKRAGQSLKGLCPFHQEKTPSFIVSPNRNTWHCFGCGEGGDIFSFIQKIEGLDFPGALKMLADRAGVQLGHLSPESTNRRQRLFTLLTLAADFYHEILVHQAAGNKARDYLAQRGVEVATQDRFRIGYAPNGWDTLQKWLAQKGFSNEEMIAAGVVGRSQRGKLYDRFRGRIIFPIADTQGRVVAFGGRIVPWHETGNEGKYINSPEGALYEKRRVVYNLHNAKAHLRGKTPVIVVEGYMDVVMMAQAGIENVVASSGTAFTSEQVSQLARFTTTLYFAFDADSAGFKAGVAATEAALAAGLKVATIVMPSGSDPADLALADPAQLQAVMKQPQSLVRVLLDGLQAAGSDDQEQHLDSLVRLVRFVKNPIQQGAMVQEISAALHIPEDRVLSLLREIAATSSGLPTQESAIVSAEQPVSHHEALVEQQFLGILLLKPHIREELFDTIKEEFFLDAACLALYNSLQQLKKRISSFLSMPVDELIGLLPEEHISFAEGVRGRGEELLATSSYTAVQEGRLLLYSLRRRWLKGRLVHVQQELLGEDEGARAAALQEFKLLTEELALIDA